MLEKIRRIPRPGLRNIKTAIASVICIVLYEVMGRSGVVLALVATFICMQDSVDKSLISGRDRIFGTILGGVFGCATAYFGIADMRLEIFAPVMFVGIVLFIYLCNNLLHVRNPIIIGLCTYLIIVFECRGYDDVQPIPYALNRTLDTIIGIVVTFVTNAVFFPPKPERYRGHDTVNPVFHYEHRRATHHKLVKWDSGFTKELYIYPENAIYQDNQFDFRVTVTTVFSERYHFRKFPGYKCQVMLLDGDMALQHDGEYQVTLGQYEQDCFMGDWETKAWGMGTDLSILTAEGFTGKLELIYNNETRDLDNTQFVSFYALHDGVKLYFNNQEKKHKELLDKEDYVVVSWFENGDEEYTVKMSREEGDSDEPLAIMISCQQQERADQQ